LYSCSAQDKSSAHYAKVLALHAEFHTVASKVLNLALTGQKAEAEKGIGDGSEYKEKSAALTKEMMGWKLEG